MVESVKHDYSKIYAELQKSELKEGDPTDNRIILYNILQKYARMVLASKGVEDDLANIKKVLTQVPTAWPTVPKCDNPRTKGGGKCRRPCPRDEGRIFFVGRRQEEWGKIALMSKLEEGLVLNLFLDRCSKPQHQTASMILFSQKGPEKTFVMTDIRNAVTKIAEDLHSIADKLHSTNPEVAKDIRGIAQTTTETATSMNTSSS